MFREQRYDNEQNGRRAADSREESGDDWDLVLLCRNEKERFFPLLMKRHYALVVNMGYRFFSDRGMAEDMAQEVFLKVYHQCDSLQPGRQPFVHWLCRITSNGCRSLYRKRSSEKRALAGGKADFWYDGEATDGTDRIDEETVAYVKLVNDALQRIKPNERMALILSHISGLKTREIAPVLQVPEYTVRRLLRRAGGKLRKLLTQQNLEHYARP